MKILNLYAGIGGNRVLWCNDFDITAVEIDPEIAKVYQKRFPDDTVVIGDAHTYLEKHFSDFDFIWSSPPCISHGQYRHNVGVIGKMFPPIMPDMRLYSEIIFLRTYAKGRWVVENTVPYYSPLVQPTAKLGRHLFWSNFTIATYSPSPSNIRSKNKLADFDNANIVSESKITNKRQVLRNCVDSALGEYVFMCAFSTNPREEKGERT